MKKLIFLLPIFLLITVGCQLNTNNVNKGKNLNINQGLETIPPAEAITAAEDGLPKYLDEINADGPTLYGFTNSKEVKEATLGNPYKVYTISNENIKNFTSNANLLSVLDTSYTWYFTVASGGKDKTLLNVEYSKNTWQVVGIGSARWASDISLIEKKWPRSNGYDKALLLVQQCDSTFIIISKNNKYNLYPVFPTSQYPDYSSNSDSYDPYTIMKILKKCINK